MPINDLIIRVITDATSALKINDSLVSSYTRVGDAALAGGADVEKGAQLQVAAGVKVIESQRAQLTQLKAIQAEAIAGSDRRIAADVAVAKAQANLNRSMGFTAAATGAAGKEAKVAERDFGKLTRGFLAGSGVAASLGRSLAFASTGFIAVAGTATLLTQSIKAAIDLGAAQHRTDQQLKVSGKSWDQYGGRISAAEDRLRHIAGFTDTDLLQAFSVLFRASNNVGTSLKFMGVAADAARALQKPLAATSVALGKALGGNLSALRRLGVSIPKNLKGMEALNFVQAKFAGQAAASTTVSQRFSAELEHSEAVIGKALLPTFTRLVGEFGNWLTRMNQSGKLQHDVSVTVSGLGRVFHTLEGAIHAVDKVTGSFGKTLVLIGEIWAGIKIAGWIKSLQLLTATWRGVEGAAVAAGAAETGAVGAGAARGAVAGGALASGEAAAAQNLKFTMVKGELTQVSSAAILATGKVGALRASLLGLGALSIAPIVIPIITELNQKARAGVQNRFGGVGSKLFDFATIPAGGLGIEKASEDVSGWLHSLDVRIGLAVKSLPPLPKITEQGKAIDRSLNNWTNQWNRLAQAAQDFSTRNVAPPAPKFTGFSLRITEQIAQARAALTTTTKDDVAVAKKIIDRIKEILRKGNYTNKGLLAILEAEASALSVVQAAQDAARQKAAAKAAAKKAAALAAASTFDIPAALQVAQAQAAAYGKSETAILKKIIRAAQRAIASGGKNWQGLVAAYNVIAQARSQLQQDAQQAVIPLKLQLQLARAEATGADTSSILKRMKAALIKALHAAKGNIQKQIDIWNQIAQINSQLGQSVDNAYGDYRKASLRWETMGLGLTADQRRALEARLSQVGPSGTHPMSGTGAAGYDIDPDTGRPIHRGHRRRGSQYSGQNRPPTVNANIDLNVYIDGKQVEATVTKRQQRRRRHGPTQRRGPNTATATA